MIDLKLQPEPCQLIELFANVANKSAEFENLGKDPIDLLSEFLPNIGQEILSDISHRRKNNLRFNYGDAIGLIIHFYFSPFADNSKEYH